jgi:adenylate cyclase
LEYDILGRAPNVASRTEGLNKLLGTHILATAPVVEGLQGRFLLRPLGLFQFVGLAVATPIVEVLADVERAGAAERALCGRFAEAMRDLETRQWARAAETLRAILTDYPQDGATRFLAERCARWAIEPPAEDAPAVVRLDSK